MPSKFKRKSGFTLIETFVAITVLVLAVLGPMTLLSQALRNSRYVKDDVVANFLSQEGVELVMNATTANLQSVASNNSCLILFLSTTTNDGYNCGSVGNKTIFSREITVVSDDPDQYVVVSKVTRTTPGSHDFTSTSRIFKY